MSSRFTEREVQGRFDLDWDDSEVCVEKACPDTLFIFSRMAEATLDMVCPQRGERVLDIGCGKAVDALGVARRGGEAVGLDPSGRMIKEARAYLGDGDEDVALVRGIGEALPFRRHSLDKVMCKGALDHFADPVKTMEEVHQVLKPGGEAVIAIANFESLSCRLGRLWYWVLSRLLKWRKAQRLPWEPPPDHTCKFDHPLLRRLVEPNFEVQKTVGISLLWTAPYWGSTVALLPQRLSQAVLSLLDGVARIFPSLSDVIIIRCTPRAGDG